MNPLDYIIVNLCNIPPAKLKIYSMFLEGFLIEIDKNKILKWNFEKSPKMFNENNKVVFINASDTNNLEKYLYISKDKYREFIDSIGQPTFKALINFSKSQVTFKINFRFLYVLLIIYYLILPVMSIIIFIKLLFTQDKNEKMFNYYHVVNISEEVYDKILKNHHPVGFDLNGRKEIIKNVIANKENIKGPWLDLGCGLKSLLLEAEGDSGAEIYLLDPNPRSKEAYEGYESKNTKVKFISGSGERLPFEDNYFSFIYCGGVIAHVCYLDKFLSECNRVLKPGGIILIDESNECPRKEFVSTDFSTKLKNRIHSNNKISSNYSFKPPEGYISNPWGYWGCSTDHFWIFNLRGLYKQLSKYFCISKKGGIGSYLCNNGNCEEYPLFYSLNLGRFTNLYLEFNNLPKSYIKLLTYIFGDIGVYIYTLGSKVVND